MIVQDTGIVSMTLPFMKELQEIENLRKDFPDLVRVKTLGHVSRGQLQLPIQAVYLGPDDPTLPVYGLFGGIHGLERIGVELCQYYLRSVCEQLKWDSELQTRLKQCRVVAIPMVNPIGVFLGTRSNGNGVDLMRNAPIEAEGRVPWLAGGHRISPRLPWFRGSQQKLETENQIVVDFVKQELFPSSLAIAMDLHSGFGFRDRFWYPHATTQRLFDRLAETKKMVGLFTKAYPNHIYQIEPVSNSYQIHGDLWDYLLQLHREQTPERIFIPWTLEMGSWVWLRKNPFQFFYRLGIYHPIKPHRHKRVMRRHQALLDFLWRAGAHSEAWKT